MEEKEVGNEEIKEEEKEKEKEKNNPQKRWKKFLIVGVIALIIIAASICIWYFLLKEDSKEKKNQYSYKFEFGDKSGKKIILYNNQNNYPILLTHDNIEESGVINKKHAYYGKNIYIIFGEHFWYLLSYDTNKILSYYESKNNEIIKDIDNTDYYLVYSQDNDSNNIVLLADAKIGTIKNYQNNSIKLPLNEEIKNFVYDSNSDTIYLVTEKTAMIIKDKSVFSQKYDAILGYFPSNYSWGFKSSRKIIVMKNNNKYIVDMYDNFKEIPINILSQNSSEEYLLEIFKYDNKLFANFNYEIFEIDDYSSYIVNGGMVITYQDKNELNYVYFKSDNLDSEMFFSFTDDFPYEIGSNILYAVNDDTQQCPLSIYVDKKTNKIKKIGHFEVKEIKDNNYYFIETECGSAPPLKIYTSTDNYLGEGFENIIDKDENVYVHDSNYIYKYDVHGNVLFKSEKYDYINNGIIIDNTLYFLAKENDNLYLVNLDNGEKAELIHSFKDEPNYNYEVRYEKNVISIFEPTEADNYFACEYNLTTKNVTKVQ